MKVSNLKDFLMNIPEEAEVYVEADHGQQSEQAGSLWIYINDNIEKLPYYGEDLDFIELDEFEKCEEEENEDIDYDKIKAIRISY